MSAHGQLDMEGGEAIDPRIEAAGKALYWADVKRRHWEADPNDKTEMAKQGWALVGKYYIAAATTVLKAYGAL